MDENCPSKALNLLFLHFEKKRNENSPFGLNNVEFHGIAENYVTMYVHAATLLHTNAEIR